MYNQLFGIIYIIGLGLIFGSFLTMVLARLNTGRSWGGRSSCMTCRHALAWYDLIPIMSFLCAGGRCRYCRAPIGLQYFLMEVLAVAWVTTVWLLVGWGSQFIILGLTGGVLLLLSFYDIRHMIIPDRLVLVLVILTLLGILFAGGSLPVYAEFATLGTWVNRIIALVGIPLPFFILWLVTKGQAMGFGDIKLMAWVGFSLGIVGGIEALLLAVWLGGLCGLVVLVLRGLSTTRLFTSPRLKYALQESHIPFGPFLALGYIANVLGLHFLGILF